jgi:hypothetical protein
MTLTGINFRQTTQKNRKFPRGNSLTEIHFRQFPAAPCLPAGYTLVSGSSRRMDTLPEIEDGDLTVHPKGSPAQ